MKFLWNGRLAAVRIAISLLALTAALGKKSGKPKAVLSKSRDLEFSSPMKNVSVALGQNAEFTCKVNRLTSKSQHLQLVWIKLDTQTILAIEKQLVQNNPRISVTQQDRMEFSLRIQKVQPDDAGVYACRFNTRPFSQMRASLDVQVPPVIVAADTSEHVVVQEGSDVLLKCKATGHPPPTITWTREDNGLIRSKGHEKTSKFKGASLHIPRVSRTDMATYTCVASNGIPPSVSQRIIVKTEFAPVVWMEPKYVAAWIGGVAELKCDVEAYPQAMYYWHRDQHVLESGAKYEIRHEQEPKSIYRMKMTLTIKAVEAKDYGEYVCKAKNHHGTIEATAKLYEVEASKRGSVSRGQSETIAGQEPLNGVRCHWRFQKDGRDCTPMYAILLLLPDYSGTYDNQQMDQNAWASEPVKASRRKDSSSTSRYLNTQQTALILGCLLWRVFMDRT